MSTYTPTQYQLHVAKWHDCQMCLLRKCRHRVVIARGKVPAEILFCGEAPGASEDVTGLPFVGPAGRLLDHILARALGDKHRYAITNLVCCIPKEAGNAKGDPPKEAILACRPRLLEFVELCQPKLIVTVGQLSQKYMPEVRGAARAGITHPAAIIRMDISQQSLAIKRCIVTIRSAAANYL